MKRSNRVYKYVMVCFIILPCVCFSIFLNNSISIAAEGDVVYVDLLNGGKIKGIIESDIDDGIIVDVGFGTVAVAREDISSIILLKEAQKERVLEERARHVGRVKANRSRKEEYTQKWQERIEGNKKLKEERLERARKARENRIRSVEDGQLVVETLIDGKVKAPLLVDTGAALVTISPETASKAGYSQARSRGKIELTLADGSTTQGTPILLKSLKVGKLKAENVGAVIAERGDMKYGLLGMSFLSRFAINIDAENNELVLKEK